MPAQQLMSLLFSIEQAVVAIAQKRGRMQDKDAEAVFVAYRQFFQDIRQGKDVDDPYSTIKRRQELYDEIWQVIVYREQQKVDDEHLRGDFFSGTTAITTHEQLYVLAFNELRKSARFWRKRNGPKGYLKHVEEHVLDTLGPDHPTFHGKIDEAPAADHQFKFDWLEEEYGIRLTLEPNRVLPEDVTEEQAIYHRSFSRNPAAHVERLREVCADYPEYPQLTNDLIGALMAAGHTEEGSALAEKMLEDHPDYLFGVSQYLTNTNNGEALEAKAHLLGPDREITHFTAGTGGAYHLQEFVKYEEAAISVFCAERNYEAPVLRIERLLDLGLPPMALANAASKVALLHFARLALADEAGTPDEVPALPPEVANAEAAVELVRMVFGRLVGGMRGE